MKVIEIFKNDLAESIARYGLKITPYVEINKNKHNPGDYATTLALVAAKELHQRPMELAELIKKDLITKPYYHSVNIAAPGFINVKINPELLSQVLVTIAEQGSNYGQNAVKDFIYNVELVSANPTGWLHIGHARNAIYADSLVRILKKDGFPTTTEYWTNDAGNQINLLAVTVFVHYLNLLGVKAELPAEAYVGEFYDAVAQALIDEHGAKFKAVKFDDHHILDPKVHQLFRQKAIAYFMAEIKKQLADIDVDIQHYSSEQAMYENGEIEKILKLYQEKAVSYKKEGALWLKTSALGDDKDRVLIKSDGSLTYLTPDLASHHLRFLRNKADKYINVWGGDHHGYIARLRAGLALIGHNPQALDIETIQMVRLVKEGQEYKMSKRKGTAVWMKDLQQLIGKDALRYMLASKTPSSQMDLDVDLLQQKNSANPVYYAQYATARAHSLLRQAKEKNLHPRMTATKLLKSAKEVDLLVTLDNFSEIIHIAATNRAPQLITDYIQNLAKQFHSYYTNTPIIDETNLELSEYRLGLVKAVLQVLTNAFYLIGLTVKEKM